MTQGPPVAGAIEFNGVSHWYRPALGARVAAVADVSLRVAPGTICGLVGPNGSGKSTLLKLAAGLTRPGRGTVQVHGQPAESAEARRRVGYLPERLEPPAWLTAAEFLAAGGELAGLPVDRLRAEVPERLAWAGLEDVADRSAAALSKGQRQRLGLAQALLGDPAVLLLDEPAAGLDPVAVNGLAGRLRELGAAGTTILLSSHFLRQIEASCDQIHLLVGGRLVWSGRGGEARTLDQIYVELAGGRRPGSIAAACAPCSSSPG